jgi:predicted PurR-regulated permease PerM
MDGKGCVVSTTETPTAAVRLPTSSNFSLRILAAAVILVFVYYAASVIITLILSVLLAYFMDPAVEFMEQFRVPRTIGALIMVLILILVSRYIARGHRECTRQVAWN